MNRFVLLIFVCISIAACSPEEPVSQLGSGEWEMGRVGESEHYPARIPGTVHTDLLANGIIPDPFFGENEKELQWIGEAVWEYRSNLVATAEILQKENINLVFEGLDTYANVYLNDTLILAADNMFRKWQVDVKQILGEGDNELSVIFSPPGEINAAKSAELPYQLPDERAFTRKSPYHFGWDWGPEFVTCGIWKPVYLRAWDGFRIESILVDYTDIDADPLPLSVKLEIVSDDDHRARIVLLDDGSGERLASEKIDLVKGQNTVYVPCELDSPELWWPAGLGEQKQYSIKARLTGGGNSDEITTTFGIREINLIKAPDEYGESFFFEVNGLPVFMKGANYIPQDNFLPRVDTSRYEALFESVTKANMNMLRVWGGGFYENDIFYDLCDKNGILVWQDFMFACNMYPGDSAFLENVKQEAADNVKRLANHPCIALWCGNNEVDEGWHNWGWQKALGYSEEDSARIWNDYLAVFHHILPEMVKQYDPGTAYHPSSPMTGWGRHEAYMKGDVHYWGVWWGEEPFEMYRNKIGRFVSEYGFQGMPPMETIESFGGLVDPRPSSPVPRPSVLEAHQKHPRGTELIQKYMEREFIVPEKFEDYVYISQVLQAEGMGQAFYTHRIAQPYCMGTLYWQLNDCWPVTSWSGLDYYGRWKALHYHVKRAYAPLMIRAIEIDNMIRVAAVNDYAAGKEVEVSMALMDFNGKVLKEFNDKLTMIPQSVQFLSSFSFEDLHPPDKVFIARLFFDGVEVSNSFLYFVPTKEMQLPDPGLTYEVTRSDQGSIIKIKAEKLARQVFLEARGLDGHFSDNFFDMAPGESREILYLGNATESELSERLKIKSIYDTY
ncbi:MAG: glycoside hydrolase family 2 protein [Bacteroidales bacterium]|nr:glycoside hydrolase family 2 protein [Bacteroidales bacterium]